MPDNAQISKFGRCASFKYQSMTLSVLILMGSLASLAVAIVELWTKLNMTERCAFIGRYFRKRRASRALGGGGRLNRVIRPFLLFRKIPSRSYSWRDFPAKATDPQRPALNVHFDSSEDY